MGDRIKISVIIPTYNRERFLSRAIKSVINQSYQPFEIIVIDDGSTDHTEKIVRNFNDRIKYFKIKNIGVSGARNYGVKQSQGDWIAFLDSDDEWLEDKLREQVKVIKQNQEIKLIHGNEIWIKNGKKINQKKIHTKSGGDIYLDALKLCLISPSAVLMTKRLYISYGGFDEDFIVCEDYDLWLKITSTNRIGFVEKPIINKYGGHSDQLSHKYKAMDYWRVKSMYNMIQSKMLSHEYRSATIKTIIKKSIILINGYKKHNNLENIDEISNILKYALSLQDDI